MELTVEAVAYLCMFLLLLGVMGLYRLSLASTGLETRPTGSQLLWPLWLLPIYFFTSQTALEVLQRLFPSPQWDTSQQLGFQSGNAASLALIFIGLVVIPPLVEETLFRGFLYTAWRRKFGFWGAAGGVSVLFALVHMPTISAVLDVGILSLFLCYLREKTGSLWPSIILHAAKNLAAFIYLFIIMPK